MSLPNRPFGEKPPRVIRDLTNETREVIDLTQESHEIIDLTHETPEIIDLTQEMDIEAYNGNEPPSLHTISERRAGTLPMRDARFVLPSDERKLEKHLHAIGEDQAALIRHIVFMTRRMVVLHAGSSRIADVEARSVVTLDPTEFGKITIGVDPHDARTIRDIAWLIRDEWQRVQSRGRPTNRIELLMTIARVVPRRACIRVE